MSIYRFESPLIQGTMIKRNSQFTAAVEIDGEQITTHIPTTNRIGDGKTVLIEVNDGFSIGSYGLFHIDYARLLSARWAELAGVEDELNF